MQIQTVGVLGCGLMGAGIAQVAAASGYKTVVRETRTRRCSTKDSAASASFSTMASRRGRSRPEDRDKTLGNLTGTTDVGALEACDLVIEAIIENLDDKAAAYAAVEAVVGEHAILASRSRHRSVSRSSRRGRGAPIGLAASTSSIPCR